MPPKCRVQLFLQLGAFIILLLAILLVVRLFILCFLFLFVILLTFLCSFLIGIVLILFLAAPFLLGFRNAFFFATAFAFAFALHFAKAFCLAKGFAFCLSKAFASFSSSGGTCSGAVGFGGLISNSVGVVAALSCTVSASFPSSIFQGWGWKPSSILSSVLNPALIVSSKFSLVVSCLNRSWSFCIKFGSWRALNSCGVFQSLSRELPGSSTSKASWIAASSSGVLSRELPGLSTSKASWIVASSSGVKGVAGPQAMAISSKHARIEVQWCNAPRGKCLTKKQTLQFSGLSRKLPQP